MAPAIKRLNSHQSKQSRAVTYAAYLVILNVETKAWGKILKSRILTEEYLALGVQL